MKRGGHPILAHALATTLATLVLHEPARAVDGTWTRLTGGNASGSWDTASNWFDDQIADGIDAIADFSTLDITSFSASISLGSTPRTVGTLKFGDAGTTSSDWRLGPALNDRLRLDVSSGPAEIIVLNRTVTVDARLSGDDGVRINNGDGPGGRLVLNSLNTFAGGLNVAGGIVQLNSPLAAGANSNIITIEGSSVETRLEISDARAPLVNDIVIESGVTPGLRHGAIEATTNRVQISGTITIKGAAENGGHLASSFPSSDGLTLRGAIHSNVPVVQAGGTVSYFGGGDFEELRVSGTAFVQAGGIPETATVTVGADREAGTLRTFQIPTISGLNLGKIDSISSATVIGALTLNGDLAAQGRSQQRILLGVLNLGSHHSIFTVADGDSDIDLRIEDPLYGRAGFTKAGTGTIQLLRDVTNTGPLRLEAGVLTGNTAISGPLTVGGGATLAPGTSNAAGAITAPSISFGPGASTVNLNIGPGGDVVEATGVDGLLTNGSAMLAIATFGGPLALGTHELIGYRGAIQGEGLAGFVLSSLPGRTIGSLVDTGTAVALNVTGNDTTIWTGATSGVWNSSAAPNWKLQSSGATTDYRAGDDVRFDDSSTVTIVTLDEPVNPSRVTFDHSVGTTYQLEGDSGIYSSAILTKSGSGTTIVRNHNSYSGVTTVGEGTLVLDLDRGSLSNTASVSVAEGATFALRSSRIVDSGSLEFTFNRPLSGEGAVVLDANPGGMPGGRTVRLTGSSPGFSGTLKVLSTPDDGNLRAEISSPAQLGTATVVVEAGAQIRLGTGDYLSAFDLAGTGYVEEFGGGTPHPGTGLDPMGGSGALVLLGNTTVAGPVLLRGNTKINDTSFFSAGSILAGNISSVDPGDQFVVGGNLTLTGTNSYGPTWINDGIASGLLQIGNDGITGTLGAGPVTLLGAANSTALLRFQRTNEYALGNVIHGIGDYARTSVEADVRGSGFSSNGHAIDLGPADATGGVFRVGQTRSDSVAAITGVLNAGRIEVASGQTNARLEVQTGGDISVGALEVGTVAGASGIVRQSDGQVTVIGSVGLGASISNTSRYELTGGALTLTAAASATFPYSSSQMGEAGGIYAGISGTGEFAQTGGTLTTNWIVLDQGSETTVGPNTPTGVDRYTLSGGLLVLKSRFGLISRVASTAFQLEGGTIQAAPGISPALDSATISVSGPVTLDGNGANSFDLFGPLGGTGELTLTGGGTLRLRDGTDAGILQTGGTMPGGSLRDVALSVDANATVRAARTGADVWTGALRGNGSLVKENAGTLFLTGTGNGFSGSTSVSAGRLDLPADFASPTISVSDGAALGGEPATANLTLGAAVGARLFFDGSTAAALTAQILTINGLTTVDFSSAPATPGPITVLNYGTKIGGGNFALDHSADYRAAVLSDTGSSIVLDVTTKSLRWTGAVNAVWDLKTTANFSDGGNADTFFAGDVVTFDDGGANPSVVLAGVLSPWRVSVESDSAAYTFSGGAISGPGMLIKSGTSTLTLAAANSYSGPTVINGGMISIGSASALGDGGATNQIVLNGGGLRATESLTLAATQSISIGAAGGTLSGAAAKVLAITGNVSGSGNLRVSGGGTVVLGGSGSEFAGNVSVDSADPLSEGTVLRLSHDEAVSHGTVTLAPTTALDLDATKVGSGVALAMNTGVAAGSRLSTFAGASDWNGSITVAGDGITQFIATHALSIRGAVQATSEGFNGILELGGEPTTGQGFLTGTVSLPDATVEKTGQGAWTVASSGNTWSETRITEGRLILGADEALPVTGRIVGGNSNLDLNGFSQTIGEFTANSLRIRNSAPGLSILTFQPDGAVTYDNGLEGNIRLVKGGPGTLSFSGFNTFSGGTIVNGGTLRLDAADNIFGARGSTLFVANGATLDVNGQRFSNLLDRVSEATVSGSGANGVGAIQNTGAGVASNVFWEVLTLTGDTTLGTDSRYDLRETIQGGTFTLTKTGTGETEWAPNADAAIGDIVIEEGLFRVNNSNNLGSNAHRIVVAAGGTLAAGDEQTNRKPIEMAGGLFTKANGLFGDTGGTSTWTGPITLADAGPSNRFSANANGRLILGGQITGSGGFEKVDEGTVDIQNAANDWSGETKVSAGTLLVSGTLAGSVVNVTGGTLGGSGMISRPVNVTVGTLAPGASIGTLSTADVTFSETADFHLEIDSTSITTDLLASISNVNLALATLTATDLGANSLTGSERLTFITADSITGTFAGLPNGASLMVGASQFTIEYSPTSVTLVAVPEPGTFAALVGGIGVLVGLRRFRRS